MRRVPQRAPKRVVDRSQVEWHEFDPRVDEYYDTNNHYTSGPGLHLPASLPYTMRTNAVPYKLFVSGIHPHTTEEGIRHIFCNYGQPLSVIRTRNKLQQPIAFVEFESQCEADNAIIELDGKPPLNWEVCYAMTRCSEERVYPQFANLSLESDFERQTPMFQISGIGRQPLHARQSPAFTHNESSMELARPIDTTPNFTKQEMPPCCVCGAQASLVCTICKTRYCSQTCQGSDWPTHQSVCRPPPALEPANQNVDINNRTNQLRGASGKISATRARANPNISFSRPGTCSSVSIEQTHGRPAEEDGSNHPSHPTELASPHSYVIKGIHPLDQKGSSNQPGDLSVTIHRNINIGSRIKTPDMRIVTDISDAPVHYDKDLSDTQDLRTTDQNKPAQGCTRSPSWNGNIAPSQSDVKSRSISPRHSQTSLNEHQYENHLGMGAKSRSSNFPLANISPKTPIQTSSQKPQEPQTAKVTKIYAKEFSSRPLEQLSDKPSKVSVCFAKSPSDIYIQYYTFQEVLGKLMADIKKSAAHSDPLINPTEGLPCLAIFPEDSSWYRAQILKILPDGIGVRYVDFGNTMKMPNTPGNLRMMEYSLSEYPFYAIKVKLAGVLPVNGSNWDRDVCVRFKEIVDNQTFAMECVRRDADAMSVRLKNRDGSNLVSRLLQENLVRKSPLEISDELDRLPVSCGTTVPSRTHEMVQKPQISQSQLHGLCQSSGAASSSVNRSPQTQERVYVGTPKESTAKGLTGSGQSLVQNHSPIRAALRQEAIVIQPRSPKTPPGAVRPTVLSTGPISSTVSSTPLPPKAQSIIEVLEAGMTVIFQMILLDNCDGFIGMLIRDEEDMGIIDFNSLAETIEFIPNFQPSVGSVVAALSLGDNQWYRGCITKVLKSSYTVLYVDYGNVEDVVSVKPIPSSYRHLTLSVKLTVVGNSELEIKQYVDDNMVLDSSHQLEVTAKDTHGSVLAKIIGENIPVFAVRLEPWTSLLPKPDLAPAPIRNITTPSWEIGFTCNVMPIIAEDVDCIYVQDDTEEIVELTCKIQKELNEYLPNSVAVPTFPVVGSCVAAVFPDDGELYRARIVETTEESVTLFYIDFGNSSTVSHSDIRELPDSFYDYPACCRRVSLAHVIRPSGPLPTAVKDLLSSCINQKFNMLVLSSTSGFTECVLTQDGKLLNELIVDAFEQSSIENRTSSPNQMPRLEAASPDSDSMPESDVPVDNTLSEMSYDDGPFMELPEGKSFQAVISNVDGPQLIMLRVADDNISTKLVRLGEELEAYSTAIIRGHGPKVNEICIARYPDGKWYRSACLDVIADPAGRRYMCIQVDYGETHIVEIDDIRRIPKRLIDYLPYLAQHTILEGTESMEEVKPELVTRFGDILPKNSEVTIRVVSRDDLAYIVRIPEVSAILSSEGLL